MDARDAAGAVVDICSGCAGVWIDWFDGDVMTITKSLPPAAPEAVLPAPAAIATCPRCRSALAQDSGMLRCGECFGVFVPKAVCDALLAGHDGGETLKPAGVPGSFFERLVASLRDLFFGDARPE
jgi:hypothetical protein